MFLLYGWKLQFALIIGKFKDGVAFVVEDYKFFCGYVLVSELFFQVA